MKKILFLIAHDGFQQIEYNVPKTILTNANVQVITASDEPGTATAKDGSTAKVDFTIDQIDLQKFDGIFIIGGPGALDCLDNSIVYALIKEAEKQKKVFGAICISSRILAKAGVLTSKHATGWDGDDKLTEIFNKYKVIYVHKPVVTDNNIITAIGPNAAEEFGQAILNILTS